MRRVIAALCFALVVISAPARADQTLRVALTAFPPGKANPHSDVIDYSGLWSALYDPLTMVTDDGELIPWLATSWVQEGPTSWTFVLRDGVTFSNGRPFNAAAVAQTVQYLISPQGKADTIGSRLTALAGIDIIDDTTVRIRTHEPRLMLPYELQVMRIPEPDAWTNLGKDGFASAPVGTGPFALDDWTAGRIALSAVPGSWRAPSVDSLSLFNVRDPNTRLAGLLTEEFDVITSVDPDSLLEIEAAGGVIRRNRIPAAIAIMFNNVKDPRFDDVKLRRALNYAVNKQAIIDVFFNGITEPATQPAPRAAVGFNTDLKPYPYDPERARQLLAQAGYEDGFSFDMDMADGSSLSRRVYQQVAVDLARVGVQMTINTITRMRYLANFQDGNWDGSSYQAGYFTPNLDALETMRGGSCLSTLSSYCDRAIVPQIEAADAEQSLERRTALVRDLMAYGNETAQALFLYEAASFTAMGAAVEGYGTHGPFVVYEGVRLTR